MKKILSLLSTILLSTIISTNVIACNTPNKNNKPIKPKLTPQKPLTNSNGKLDNNPNFINYIIDNKGYTVIFENNTKYGYIVNLLNNSTNDKILGTFSFYEVLENIYLSNLKGFFEIGNIKSVYRGDGDGEPITPTIDKTTGKITDGNEKIKS